MLLVRLLVTSRLLLVLGESGYSGFSTTWSVGVPNSCVVRGTTIITLLPD